MTPCPSLRIRLALALATAGGCSASDDDAADEAADTSTGAADSSTSSGTSGGDVDALFECDDPMLTPIGPLVGPGYDETMGGLLAPVVDTYLVSTTAALPYPETTEDFLALSNEVELALEASGVVAWQLAYEPNCGFFRTLTIWREPGDMAAFIGSPAHATAIARSSELVLAGKVTHWQLPAEEFPPTWDMAKAELVDIPPFGGGY